MSRTKGSLATNLNQESQLRTSAAAVSVQARHYKPGWMLGLSLLLLVHPCAQAQFGPQLVGSKSGAQSVTVTAKAAGTVNNVEVLTLGAVGVDFATGTGVSTCATAVFSASGQSCTASVTFTPAVPGLRMGAIVLLDASANVLGTSYLSGTGSGGLGVLTPGNDIPVAGNGTYLGSVEDGNAATAAELYLPSSVAVDGSGNLYIADSAHNRIRMVCASPTSATIKGTTCIGPGIISTIAGNGNPAYLGDNGTASAATVNDPTGVALDGAGNLYVADTGNNVIRVISAATGLITTVAGNGSQGSGGDSGAAIAAQLNQPQGVTLDGLGNLYIADTANHRIRMVTAATGKITTVAGNGFTLMNGDGGYSGDNGLAAAAELNFPHAVAFDAAGNMYIPDTANNRIREVAAVGGAITAASTINTFGGNGTASYAGDGAAANQAELWGPSGVAVDAARNVYIADTQNNAIRKVNPATLNISTLAVNGRGAYYYSGAFLPITFYGPTGLYLDGSGNLYVADTLNMIVREFQGNFVALDFKTPVRQFDKSTPMSQTIENDGNAPLDLTAFALDANSAVDNATTTCNTGTPFLAAGVDCTIGAVLAPSVAGNPLVANIDIGKQGDTANAPLDIQLVGDATSVNSTTITVASSLNPSGFGQSVTFPATVTTGASAGNLTGTVTFYDGATPISPGVALGTPGTTATATFTASTLAVGKHTISGWYSGDVGHSTSRSTDPNGTTPALTQNVLEGTHTNLLSSLNPTLLGQNVTFTATVMASAGGGVTPDGTVTFFDGSTILGNVALNGSAVATYSTTTLTAGNHPITAVYGGDPVNDIQGSTTGVLTQDAQTATSAALLSSQNPSNYGSPVTFTATITVTGSVAATGTVDFLDGGVKIGTGTLAGSPAAARFATSALNVGTHAVTASYSGDANNAGSSSAPVSQVINQAQTATTAGASPSPGIGGAAVAITATVKPVAGASIPTGMVTFTCGTTTLGSAALNAGGTATINPVLAPGQYSILAEYGGDANDGASTSTALALTVGQATTQTHVTAVPNPTAYGTTVTFTAKVAGNGGIPSGTEAFRANGTQFGVPVTLDATGTAKITYSGLAAGSYTITAVYGGDANDQGSTGTSAAQLVVAKLATTTDLTSSTTTGPNSQLVLVAAVLTASGTVPTGNVTFNDGTTGLGTVALDSSGVATLTPSLTNGSHSIVAVYSGDATHSPSTSQTISVSGTGGAFNVGVTPSTLTIKTSQNATVNVALSSSAGFTDTIGLGCASLPVGVTCHFSPTTVPLAANGTVTDQLTIDTNNPLSGGASAAYVHRDSRGTYLAGVLLPFSLFFGWVFWRFRRRQTGLLTMVLVVVLSAAALFATGCSGFSMGSAAPGTYVIQVTGTGTNSNTIHYQDLTLTITN
jgi:sugar lactone lactonase YvrE